MIFPLKKNNHFLTFSDSFRVFNEFYGKRTGSILVHPFGFYDSERFFSEYSREDRFKAYSILGGVPQYLEAFNSSQSLEENIQNNILKKGSLLYEEPRFLTMQEFRNPALYNSIIETVADGYTKLYQIASKVGESADKTAKYMTALLDLKIVERLQPIGLKKNSRKSLYRIKDNYFRFYYYFITKNHSLLEQDMVKYVYEALIKPMLNNFFGQSFEEVCREYLVRENKKMTLPFVFTEIGSWWGNNPVKKLEEEIDILAINGKQCIVGECKWRNRKMNRQDFERLFEKSMLLPYEKRYFYLFSKSGFEKDLITIASERDDLILVTFDSI